MTVENAKALLFDLGGVVMDIDFNRTFAMWAAYGKCDLARVAARVKFGAAYDQHERGEIDAGQFFTDLRRQMNLDLTDAQMLEGWNALFIGEIPGIGALLHRLRGKIPLYAFSNTNAVHEVFWSAKFADVMKNFDRVFVSSAMGLRKPEPAAFEYVVREIGIPAGNVLFFDDLIDNVEGARACGLQAVHVKSHDDVAGAVAALGL